MTMAHVSSCVYLFKIAKLYVTLCGLKIVVLVDKVSQRKLFFDFSPGGSKSDHTENQKTL